MERVKKIHGDETGAGNAGAKKRTKTMISIVAAVTALAVTLGLVWAFFSDKAAVLPRNIYGEVRVQLIELPPFDDTTASSLSPETAEKSVQTGTKIFWGKSLGMGITYIRASIRTVVEVKLPYNFEDYVPTASDVPLVDLDGTWQVLPVSNRDIVYELSLPDSIDNEALDAAGDWVAAASDGTAIPGYFTTSYEARPEAAYFYYSQMLLYDDGSNPESFLTKPLQVDIKSINIHEKYRNLPVRYTIQVTLDGAQVSNDLWKGIFGIENLPFTPVPAP